MKHPAEAALALYAGGDLTAFERWRLRRHVSRCPECAREVEAFQTARRLLRETAAELPAGLHWGRMAAEMAGNIRVGLAAGECVGGRAVPRPLGWRAAVALASLTLLILSGWWLNLARPVRQAPVAALEQGVVLEATPAGIELKQDGRSFTLLHPSAETVTYTADLRGGLRARYVDAETGQVTVNNVYVQ